jgi:VanZ family protein
LLVVGCRQQEQQKQPLRSAANNQQPATNHQPTTNNQQPTTTGSLPEMPTLRTLWWSLGGALLALITALSLLPIRGPDLDLPNSDKLNHAIAYLVLMLYFGQLVGAQRRSRATVAAALIGYGIAIELLQALLPLRVAELADLAANAAGIALGLLLLRTPIGGALVAIERHLGHVPRR